VDDAAAGRFGDFERRVGRSAVDDHHLLDQPFDDARHQGGQGADQVVFGVEGRNDDGNHGTLLSFSS
jgi:hypothetical protein